MATGLQPAPEFGIKPIPPEHRVLGTWDNFVLWADLGVSFLVMAAAALIVVVSRLQLAEALVAILIGALLGNLLLGLAAIVGADIGAPTMVLLRPALGRRGSYLPSAANILQLIGWAVFEIIIMAQAANAIGQALFGFSAYALWVFVFGALATALAVFGPVAAVKQWMQKFALWLVLVTTVWLTVQLANQVTIGELLARPGGGGNFWHAVDLAVALPISWMPLVADYSRFARRSGAAFWGTSAGYFAAQVWFYVLGVLLALSLAVAAPGDIMGAIARLTGGALMLLVILADEVDEAFANVYSTAVSILNIVPGLGLRPLAIGVGALSTILAIFVPLDQYELFLILIGSAFVPLLGVLAADYFVLRRRRYDPDELYPENGSSAGFRWPAILVWLVGVAIYLWIGGITVQIGGQITPITPANLPWLGASLPTFGLIFMLYLLVCAGRRRG
jgi:NCS1 family nucleobase:cation symporter-1